jgi:hypothetical protein
VIDETVILGQLRNHGWTLDSSRGVTLPNFASVSVCLMHEGHRSICIPGYGETRDLALEDAVRGVHAWIARQPVNDAPPPYPRSKRTDNRFRRRPDTE